MNKFEALTTEFIAAKSVGENITDIPLLVVLHGLGDSIEGYRFLPEILKIDKLSYLLVNAPDSYFMGYSWFDLQTNPEPGVLRSRKLLFELFDFLQNEGWEAKDLALFGFSQGGLMTIDFAINYPKVIAGCLAISGYVGFLEQYPEAFSEVAREQRIFVSHGSQDCVLPISDTRQQIRQLQQMDLNINWYEYNKAHDIEPVNEIPEIRNFLLDIIS